MKIKILRKKYPCNKAKSPNKVWFEVDGKLLTMDIYYIPSEKANYFIESSDNMELKKYIIKHYDIEWNTFLGAFLHELRIYSHYRNLSPVIHFNVDNIKYKGGDK